jgi:3'(2'), 5'-bisphosphate nucleotidase
MDVYGSEFAVHSKSDRTPLTQADMRAHKTICAGLRDLDESIPVLSEESAAAPFPERQSWQRYWLVDPLDGTREFIKRNGEFTVNIALIEQHRPVLGVVAVPANGLVYYASAGHGAFRKEADAAATPIHTRPTRPDRISLAGSRSHGSEEQQRFIDSLGKGAEVIAVGSALKFCLVAEGKVDIYPRFGPTSEWDTAAAQCVVQEAGGRVLTMDLEPLLYNAKESLLNPHFLVVGDPAFDWKPYLARAGTAVN